MTTVLSSRIQVIDSHTAGEPTRVVIAGGPDLGDGPLPERLNRFRNHFDSFRSAVVNEPRGSDVLVGALLCKPVDPTCVAGVIFFNNVGTLGMCGHGAIGLVATLAHMGKIRPGRHKIETPVGIVSAALEAKNDVTIENVASYRSATGVRVGVEGIGEIVGDVAWGGNWFFLVNQHGEKLCLANIDRLVDVTWRIRQALKRDGVTGTDGKEIDHIELFGPPQARDSDSKNFVLCPGKAYDRSPCGTGTSAKIACLIADGKLKEGQRWRQESIIGSIFEGYATIQNGQIIPSIQGSAYITGEMTLLLQEDDPFRLGIRS
ncbi:MAG: proline racemase family protein [Gemmataceae bacterium]